jgi:hypothetical protein
VHKNILNSNLKNVRFLCFFEVIIFVFFVNTRRIIRSIAKRAIDEMPQAFLMGAELVITRQLQ